MKESSMYSKDLAKYYDIMYQKKDYKKETAIIETLISKYKKSKGRELLEVACGTGNYLKYLKDNFNCTGLDLNEEMLRIAKKKSPKLQFFKANMINFALNKKFDVVACLFCTIGQVKTYSNLEKALKSFSKHLNKGGVVIIGSWFSTVGKSGYKVGMQSLESYEKSEVRIARMIMSKLSGNISILEMHYLIAEKGRKGRKGRQREETQRILQCFLVLVQDYLELQPFPTALLNNYRF